MELMLVIASQSSFLSLEKLLCGKMWGVLCQEHISRIWRQGTWHSFITVTVSAWACWYHYNHKRCLCWSFTVWCCKPLLWPEKHWRKAIVVFCRYQVCPPISPHNITHWARKYHEKHSLNNGSLKDLQIVRHMRQCNYLWRKESMSSLLEILSNVCHL